MAQRDDLHDEAEDIQKNEGYLQAHEARVDLARRADAAKGESLQDRIARQKEDAERAARDRR